MNTRRSVAWLCLVVLLSLAASSGAANGAANGAAGPGRAGLAQRLVLPEHRPQLRRGQEGHPAAPPQPAATTGTGPMLGFTYASGSSLQQLVVIDPAGGSLQTRASFPLGWVAPNQFVLDPDRRLAYLAGWPSGATQISLYSVALDSGAVVSQTLPATGEAGFGFALAGAGALAAYDYHQPDASPLGSPAWRILRLDPASGALTQAAVLDADWVAPTMFAVDTTHRIAYLGGRKDSDSLWRLYQTDLDSGAVVSSTLLSAAVGSGALGFAAYLDGDLLAYRSQDALVQLFSLDPSSGVTASLATLAVDFTAVDQFAVDTTHRTAYLGGWSAAEGAWRIYTIDLSSGQSTSVVVGWGQGGAGFGLLPALQASLLEPKPAALTNLNTATFTYTASGGLAPLSFATALDSAAWGPTSPLTHTSLTGLADGEHVFWLKAVDDLLAESVPVSYTWTVDTAAPAAPLITSPANGSRLPYRSSGVNLVTFSGTASAGAVVRVYQVSAGSLLCSALAGADGSWSCTTTTGFAPGVTITVYATATDPAGSPSAPSDLLSFELINERYLPLVRGGL